MEEIIRAFTIGSSFILIILFITFVLILLLFIRKYKLPKLSFFILSGFFILMLIEFFSAFDYFHLFFNFFGFQYFLKGLIFNIFSLIFILFHFKNISWKYGFSYFLLLFLWIVFSIMSFSVIEILSLLVINLNVLIIYFEILIKGAKK